MDSAHSQLEQQLQQIKKVKITAETDVDQTRRKQNEQDWLEEDSDQLTQEKLVLLDFLRSGWQGEEASGFHRYLEEQQQEESQAWRRDLQDKRTDLDKELQENKDKLHTLETKQATLQKEWSK
ncbi:ribonuclease P [Listeria monocytogenes]|uniref:Ribonuclease P n=1 Tax=Listeria monocytogenes TaxID=1639 RepID=A0A7U7TUL7_LISMN|nr:ribonuclease P [Listeria monocytogenes]MDA20830.1 ribonuclease P [Listeria monocytogenes serotype 4a]EAC3358500.1 ribonuclease P [Listeria monocytogenes]EAC3449587.1 ribonuclease P [Listeria monocytogenes]EAC7296599.1 ribonuclease P [Listeria monocytogenes]EAC7302127.1 ribonuclease P [Listeria monocytogenes]